jgi:hypothetical protein
MITYVIVGLWNRSGVEIRPPEAASKFTEEQVVDWLIDECRDAGTRIAAITTSGDRVVAIGSTVIALSTTVALSDGKSYLLMWLPLSVSVVMVYMLHLYNMVRTLRGYKIGLEEEIERRVGVAVIAWQSLVSERGRVSPHMKSAIVLSATTYLGSAALGLIQAFGTLEPRAWGHERAWLFILLTILSVVIGLGIIGYLSWAQRSSQSVARQRMAGMFAAAAR